MNCNQLAFLKTLFSISLVFAGSCKKSPSPKNSASTSEESEVAGNDAKGLSISGEWAVSSICAVIELKAGVGASNSELVGLNYTYSKPSSKVVIKMDPKGIGWMKGKQTCKVAEADIGAMGGFEASAPSHVLDWINLLRRAWGVYCIGSAGNGV